MIADQLSLMRALMPQAGPQPAQIGSPDLLGGIGAEQGWPQALGQPMGMQQPFMPQAMGQPGQVPMAPITGNLPGQAPMVGAGPTVTVPTPKPQVEDPLMLAIKQLVMGR